MIIARAEVAGSGQVDVEVTGSSVTRVARRVGARAGEDVLDARGGALLPGLHDHHVHLMSLAASLESVWCGPPSVTGARTMAQRLSKAKDAVPGAWTRAVGYDESVAGDLDRWVLDGMVADRPVRVQHRSGQMWVLNSAGLAALGVGEAADPGAERDGAGRLTGRLFGMDRWLAEHARVGSPPGLEGAGQVLARAGVTGVTDASAHNGTGELAWLGEFSEACGSRVVVMGTAELGGYSPRPSRVEIGPVKLVLHERALPGLEDLATRIREAHGSSRRVALHATTAAELVLALGALGAAGPVSGDRVEHASVVTPELLPLLARSGATVVTQPNFVYERGDRYLAEVDPREVPDLYRCGGLIGAGVPVGAGTDAPFGDPDPWAAMGAAVERRTRAGSVVGPHEAVPAEEALRMFLSDPFSPGGPVRRVEAGGPADLCLLREPWRAARHELSRDLVVATVTEGRLVHLAE